MEWTTDKPTESGWYWVWHYPDPIDDYEEINPYMVRVEYVNGELIANVIGDCDWALDTFDYFMGPIPQPEPPTISADQAQKANV